MSDRRSFLFRTVLHILILSVADKHILAFSEKRRRGGFSSYRDASFFLSEGRDSSFLFH